MFILKILFVFFFTVWGGIMSLNGLNPIEINADEVCILAVRHGEGDRNKKGTNIQGWVDDAASYLNSMGVQQAEIVAQAIADNYPEIAAIYTSDLSRCIQTAEKIANRFIKEDEFKPIPDSRLREINHGIYDTMSYNKRNEFCKKYYEEKLCTEEGKQELLQKFQETHPGYSDTEALRFIKWGYNPMQEIPLHEAGREPEYAQSPTERNMPETIMQLFLRVSEVFKSIGCQHKGGETVVVVAHAGVIKTLATEAETRQEGNLFTPLPTYYESNLPESKIISGNCSCQVFYYNKRTGTIRFDGSADFAKMSNKG